MSRSRWVFGVLGLVLVLLGLVWFFQGIGVIGGSFMSSDPTWSVIGGAVVVGGVLLLVGSRRSR